MYLHFYHYQSKETTIEYAGVVKSYEIDIFGCNLTNSSIIQLICVFIGYALCSAYATRPRLYFLI